jgi:hypothetical protein
VPQLFGQLRFPSLATIFFGNLLRSAFLV